MLCCCRDLFYKTSGPEQDFLSLVSRPRPCLVSRPRLRPCHKIELENLLQVINVFVLIVAHSVVHFNAHQSLKYYAIVSIFKCKRSLLQWRVYSLVGGFSHMIYHHCPTSTSRSSFYTSDKPTSDACCTWQRRL